MTVNTNKEMEILGWDDEVEAGGGFTLLPKGDYPFLVTGFERGIYEKPVGYESKVPANCPKAIVTVELTGPNGETTTLTENFFLYNKMQWKINQFFTSIGAAKNEKGTVRMNWGSVLGSRGTAKVVVNNYKDKKTGDDKQNNRIDTFNEPTQQAAAAGYQAPQPNYQAPPAQQPVTQQQPTTPFPANTAPQTPPPAGNYNFGGH